MEIHTADERQVEVASLRKDAAVEDPRVVLVREGNIQFPAICPNCGAPAAQKLFIERAFSVWEPDGDNSTTTNLVDTFEVPFCDACIRLYEAQREPPTTLTTLKRVFSEGEGAGGGIVAFVGLFFLKEAVVKFSFILLLFAALPLGVGYWLMRTTWKRNRHVGVPRPTPVDSAIEFTPILSLPYESQWRAFQLRLPDYSAAFRKLNEDILWDLHSGEVRAAAFQRKESSFRNNLIIGAVVVAVLLYAAWDYFFGKG